MKVLLTGGAGYIGSHTALTLLDSGHDVVVIDNLANSSPEGLRRVEDLTGRSLLFIEADILDRDQMFRVLTEESIDSVIHFAGLKAVGESVAQPLEYYANNVGGTISLLQAMGKADVRSIVFSSSATVYGAAEQVPMIEKMPLDATNPYGRTKEQIEDILTDLAASDERWHVALLRYFNPVGAHPSGRIGEDPQGIPNNLMPFIAQVAVGRRDKLIVHGNDYPTPDGTCIRDYIHVLDLAAGHLAALEFLPTHPGAHVWNLGTGHGSSVLEVFHAFERAVGHELPYEIGPRRPGDSPVSYADSSGALADLSWSASRTLDQMCADHWRWQQDNPNGYRD